MSPYILCVNVYHFIPSQNEGLANLLVRDRSRCAKQWLIGTHTLRNERMSEKDMLIMHALCVKTATAHSVCRNHIDPTCVAMEASMLRHCTEICLQTGGEASQRCWPFWETERMTRFRNWLSHIQCHWLCLAKHSVRWLESHYIIDEIWLSQQLHLFAFWC